jgi:C-terminal binding protein
MEVCFYDPYILHGYDKSYTIKRYDDLEEMLGDCDVISINCLLSNETKHIINKNNIKKFKKGSFLVNTARGPIVEEEALIYGLKVNFK